jgi:hypothetical protein
MMPGCWADEPTTPATFSPAIVVRLGTVGPAGRFIPMTPALSAAADTPTPLPFAWARIAAGPRAVKASTAKPLTDSPVTPLDQYEWPLTPSAWSDTPTTPSSSREWPITAAVFGAVENCSSAGLSPHWPITPQRVHETPKTPCLLLDVPTTPASS